MFFIRLGGNASGDSCLSFSTIHACRYSPPLFLYRDLHLGGMNFSLLASVSALNSLWVTVFGLMVSFSV